MPFCIQRVELYITKKLSAFVRRELNTEYGNNEFLAKLFKRCISQRDKQIK